MTNLEAIHKIQQSNAKNDLKHAFCTLASEWIYFLQLKRKCNGKGLMKATYKNLGVKFIGLYGINTLNDLVWLAEHNTTLKPLTN